MKKIYKKTKGDGCVKKFGSFVARNRILILIISILLVFPALYGMANTKINYDILSYLPSKLDSVKGQKIIGEQFNDAATSMAIIENMEHKDVVKIKDKISKIDGVESVLWLDDVLDIEKSVNPDLIQIHGFFEEDFYEAVRNSVSTKIIHALLIDKYGKSHVIDKDPVTAAKIIQDYSDAVLIDKYIPNKLGGTGTTVNWDVASKIKNKIHIPVILSGGLNENNVIEAIKKVNPYAIDVSSGVEKSPGIKDSKKIENFIKLVKEAKI